MRSLRSIFFSFISIRTAVWLILALLLLLFFGSLAMPAFQEYRSLQAVPLFDWLSGNPPRVTWWLWGAVFMLSLLTANTLLCSIESVVRKREARKWLLIISPQIIHTGFLFILFAHLLSSYGSFRGNAFAHKDTVLPLPSGNHVLFKDISARADGSGYVTDWSAQIQYFRDGTLVREDVILPNSPSFQDGFGIYIQTVRVIPFPVAMIEVSREPGAPWALAGGVLFLAGATALLFLKIVREDM